MKYLRRVPIRCDKKRQNQNDKIRDILKVQPVIKRIEEGQLKWFGHNCRINEGRPVRQCGKEEDNVKSQE